MEELIKTAIKAMQEGMGFNEIELSDGVNKVRLVRFTPAPYITYPLTYTYQNPYQPYQH